MEKNLLLRFPQQSMHSQYVICVIAEEYFGIPIGLVREVVDMSTQMVSRIPESPTYIEGVINLRGQIIPLMDGRKKLKFRLDTQPKLTPKALILENEKELFGFLIDEVYEVKEIVEEQLDTSAQGFFGKDRKIGRISGKDPNEQSEQLVILLSKEQLFETKRTPLTT